MNYTDPVIFVRENGSKYDPDAGKHTEPKQSKTERYANVTDLGTDRSVALFGSVKEGSKVIRLPNCYTGQWDYVLIGEKSYNLVTERRLRRKHTIIVKEFVR